MIVVFPQIDSQNVLKIIFFAKLLVNFITNIFL